MLLNSITILSLILCPVTIVLYGISLRATVGDRPHVRLGADVRVGVWDGRLSIYNTDLPYTGGIITVTSGSNPRGGIVSERALDFPAYFRHFRWTTHSIWVLTVPIPALLVLTAILPLAWLLGSRRT